MGRVAVLAALLAGACAEAPPAATGAGAAAAPGTGAERLVMPPALPGWSMTTPSIRIPESAPDARPAMAERAVAPDPATVQPIAAPPPAIMAAAPNRSTAPPILAAAAPKPRPVATPQAVPVPASLRGEPRVQLVAAGSEAEAQAHWAGFTLRLPDLAEGRVPEILALERPGQATIWRLRIGGFADPGEARAWCDRLRERGRTCWVSG